MISTFARSALFHNGFRPFFLGGSVFAVLAILAWILIFSDWITVPAGANPMDWHAHEMTFGFFGAILGGFLLTAMPNWTGRPPLSGDNLMGLFVIWMAGRVAMTAYLLGDPSASSAGIEVAIVDLLYPILLLIYAATQVIHAKAIHNLPIIIMIGLFAVANLLFHIAPYTSFDHRLGPHLGLAVAAMLIALIGGSIIPNFTRNWLASRSPAIVPAEFDLFDKAALLETAGAIIGWAFVPDHPVTGLLLAVASVLGLIRLARWQGLKTTAEPLVLILHVGYLWLTLALAALAINALFPSALPGASALHVLTAGAMGVMMLAVMTRATRGHTGKPLLADRATVIIYVLVNVGALLRVAAPFLPLEYAVGAGLAGAVWAAAWLMFVVNYGPWLISPRS